MYCRWIDICHERREGEREERGGKRGERRKERRKRRKERRERRKERKERRKGGGYRGDWEVEREEETGDRDREKEDGMEGGREEREGQREVDKERVVRMELWDVGGDNRETDFFSISHSVTSAQPHYFSLLSRTWSLLRLALLISSPCLSLFLSLRSPVPGTLPVLLPPRYT
jgi:hypothetical protein